MIRRNRKPNFRRAKLHHSYSIAETARLLNVSRNTVQYWATRDLEVIRIGRTVLILGEALRDFGERRRSASRTKLKPGEFYCLRCRAAVCVLPELVEIFATAPRTVNLRGLCSDCDGFVHRRVAVAGLVLAGFPHITGAPDSHLNDSPCPSLNCAMTTGI